MNRWQPVTIPANAPANPDGIDFVLTPVEQSKAAAAAKHLDTWLRQQNRNDTAQSLADALAREFGS